MSDEIEQATAAPGEKRNVSPAQCETWLAETDEDGHLLSGPRRCTKFLNHIGHHGYARD